MFACIALLLISNRFFRNGVLTKNEIHLLQQKWAQIKFCILSEIRDNCYIIVDEYVSTIETVCRSDTFISALLDQRLSSALFVANGVEDYYSLLMLNEFQPIVGKQSLDCIERLSNA